jgi:EAL domain-containing protein (putative c-di-GMP-specific phosphodiesterase class I)
MKKLVRVTNSLNSKVVALGIDNEMDLKVVRALGISLGQGFLWGEPEILA